MDKGENIRDYSENQLHFTSRELPPLLIDSLKKLENGFTLVDLGCGDGVIIRNLKDSGHLKKSGKVFGVDISAIRIKRFTQLTGYPGVVSEGGKIGDI